MNGFIYVSKQGEINNFFSDLLKVKELFMDTEATSLDTFTSTWLLLQIKIEEKIYILDCRKLGRDILTYIIETIKNKNLRCTFHNAKFDLEVIYNNTGILLTNVYCTMISETLINQGVGKQYYSYVELAEKYLGVEVSKEERSSFADYEGDITNQQLIYSSIDVLYLDKIKSSQIEILKKQKQLGILDIESRLIPVVTAMELNGVRIDEVAWRENIVKYQTQSIEQKSRVLDIILDKIDYRNYNNLLELVDILRIPAKTKKLRSTLESIIDLEFSKTWLRNNFNIGSYVQLKSVFKLMGIEVDSTGEEVIKPLRDKYPIIDGILSYREAEKRISTYGENVLSEIHPITGRLHVDFNQVGTQTGRFTAPRLHQIPADAEYRKPFIGRDGYKILTADYSQLEYRLVGAFTGDRRIIDAYLAGKDMHTATAALLYKISMEDVTKDQRSKAKNINFATLYWSSVGGLMYKFGISEVEAKEIIETLTIGYPTFMAVREYVGEMVMETLKAVTPLGRIRFFEGKTLFKDSYDAYRYERSLKKEGWNHTIQGWGADIIKLSMNEIFYYNPFNDNLLFYNQVHDEIDVEVSDKLKNECKDFVVDCMEKCEQSQLGELPASVGWKLEDHWVK